MEPSIENLKNLTDKFFSMHWYERIIGIKPPTWSELYTFEGSLPNYNKQGVYVFIKGQHITYIGVATSNGTGIYRGHGLGKRFQAYTKVINNKHTPTEKRLIDAGAMLTIGFEQEQAYLANALELFLIGRLNTEHNLNRPGN